MEGEKMMAWSKVAEEADQEAAQQQAAIKLRQAAGELPASIEVARQIENDASNESYDSIQRGTSGGMSAGSRMREEKARNDLRELSQAPRSGMDVLHAEAKQEDQVRNEVKREEAEKAAQQEVEKEEARLAAVADARAKEDQSAISRIRRSLGSLFG